MKIVYLHQYFKTPDQNGGTRSYEMAKRLVRFGHEVHIVTSENSSINNKAGWRTYTVEGISIHTYRNDYNNKMGFYQRIWSFLKFSLSSSFKASRIKPDLVFATSTPLTIAIPGLYASKTNKCPFIFEVRDLWPLIPIELGYLKNPILKYLANFLEYYSYKKANAIVALSPGMADGIQNKIQNKNKKIAIIPNGCDIDIFSNSSQECNYVPCENYIIYPGTFGIVNGVCYLVDLAEELIKIGSSLSIIAIGDGVEREKIIAHAKEKKVLGKNFFVLDPVSKIKLSYAIKKSKAVISTTIDKKCLADNSANKFFDALAAAKPIIINYGGWQKDLIESKKIGILLNNDITESAKKLDADINKKNLMDEYSRNGLELAQSMFNRDKLAKDLETIFLQIHQEETSKNDI